MKHLVIIFSFISTIFAANNLGLNEIDGNEVLNWTQIEQNLEYILREKCHQLNNPCAKKIIDEYQINTLMEATTCADCNGLEEALSSYEAKVQLTKIIHELQSTSMFVEEEVKYQLNEITFSNGIEDLYASELEDILNEEVAPIIKDEIINNFGCQVPTLSFEVTTTKQGYALDVISNLEGIICTKKIEKIHVQFDEAIGIHGFGYSFYIFDHDIGISIIE